MKSRVKRRRILMLRQSRGPKSWKVRRFLALLAQRGFRIDFENSGIGVASLSTDLQSIDK
jgi:hypothetical protein